MADSIIQQKSFAFGLKILKSGMRLQEMRQYMLSQQVLRSGTSIGANVEEATAGLSKADFRAKMAIASKEARETRYWLRLMHHSGLFELDLTELLREIEEIIRIITSIVKTLDGQLDGEKRRKRDAN